jgi:superfamily II DNA helicase RecQ
MFFDESHVAFTDVSYRKQLRELWKLRYMDCPFTCLTATLIVQLEDILREKLLIPETRLFRRSTARRTIRYSVQDSGDEAPSVFGLKVIQGLVLPAGKRGVIYIRSYATGETISGALQCPFYKARADDKGELLQEWMRN